ncbi:MAG: hypothetical protein WC554_05950 [Clostridia bacterium]
MTDIQLLHDYLNEKNFHNKNTSKIHLLKKFPVIINKYIIDDDSLDFGGQLYCLFNNIKYPKCIVCQKPYRFVSFKKGFLKFCSNKCDRHLVEYDNNLYTKEFADSNILVCEEHQTYITNKIFQKLILNKAECLCEKCSLKIRSQVIIDDEITEKTKNNLINVFLTRKRHYREYMRVYFPYTFNKINSIKNVKPNNFENRFGHYLYGYDLKCKTLTCNNLVTFDWAHNPREYCETCSRKMGTKRSASAKSKYYWPIYINQYFNVPNVEVEIKDIKTIIIKNYCKHHDKLEIKKHLIKKLKGNGIYSLCVECNREYYLNLDINDDILKNNWESIKTLSEEQLLFKNPYVWSFINKQMIKENVGFSEAKYMLYYNIKEKPKCNCCDKPVKFSADGYSYLIHCEDHLTNYSISSGELEISEWLKIYNISLKQNDRTQINKELDIFISNKNLAIEYNGLYWHSEEYKEKSYHYNKWKECNDKGIKLLTIWEDDWTYKTEIVKSIIKNQLGLTENRIYGRNTKIKLVEYLEKKDFLDKNHIQGNCQSSINLGLYYNNELVSLMTFGKKRMVLKSKSADDEYELLRFCNKLMTSVVGGASKLFSYFIKNFKPQKIISYANCDISSGQLYETLGFNNLEWTGLNYWWVKDGKRYHRSNFMKHKLVKQGADPNKTEKEIMREKGYNKIWGTGNLKFEWSL